jgi:hypothetical protein
MSRADFIRTATPDLIATVRLYSSAEGGRTQPVAPGFGCLCTSAKSLAVGGYDALPLLRDLLFPGETRRIGFALLTPEAAVPAFSAAGMFYLWDGGFIGEAVVEPGSVSAPTPPPDT